ncbi:MAG: PAS domain-containing protein, partial [Nitrospira sp.]|nr:PAS domain-containing protein [Nitrospira sp.]
GIDITDRKMMETEQTQLKRAIDEGLEGVALLNTRGRYTYMNTAYSAIYGYGREDLLGQTWAHQHPSQEIIRIKRECLPALERSGSWQGELIGKKKTGQLFAVEISLSTLPVDQGAVPGYVCICRDITERKKA